MREPDDQRHGIYGLMTKVVDVYRYGYYQNKY